MLGTPCSCSIRWTLAGFPMARCTNPLHEEKLCLFDHLSYYVIFTKENNSIHKGCLHEDLLLHFYIETRLCMFRSPCLHSNYFKKLTVKWDICEVTVLLTSLLELAAKFTREPCQVCGSQHASQGTTPSTHGIAAGPGFCDTKL